MDGKSDLKERDLPACSKLFDANDLRRETAIHYQCNPLVYSFLANNIRQEFTELRQAQLHQYIEVCYNEHNSWKKSVSKYNCNFCDRPKTLALYCSTKDCGCFCKEPCHDNCMPIIERISKQVKNMRFTEDDDQNWEHYCRANRKTRMTRGDKLFQ